MLQTGSAPPSSSPAGEHCDLGRESIAQRQLFIAGCPRSGTSALVFLLNEHPQLAIGFERFKRVRAHLDPFHFAPAQFFSPVLAETDIRGELLYTRLYERWRSGSVSVIGDKVPLYWRVLPQLFERFPHGRVVLLVRELEDVAASFKRRAGDPEDWWPAENDHTLAVAMWNEALERARDAERLGHGERIFLLPYEPLLAGDERWLAALMCFVGLPLTASLRTEQRRLAERWSAWAERVAPSSELRAYVEARRDAGLERWARERMDLQLGQGTAAGAKASAGSGLGEDVSAQDAERLDDREREQRDERERERAQLLGEMRRPGRREEQELETLERRLSDQARELVRRAEELRQASRLAPNGSCATRSRAGKPRVTFLLPHQRPTTGGVYVIEQLARHLSARLATSIVVRGDGPLRQVPGVELRCAAKLDPAALPPADVLVYPADMSDAGLLCELPASAGRPVMFFQGYGTPGSPVVAANLAAAESSVAIAHWLVEDARRVGVPCVYVPQGLDRAVFAPGPKSSERPPRVTLMTHRLDWKGVEDALTALSLVRAARDDVEVALFGSEPVEGEGSFLESPTRPEVATLLRSSAVHVVASWEEGFGLIGAEAIACGAALATTDTKGSRDYALDGRTALVSPTRDPRALAENILKLLDDAGLRDRLILAGQRHLRGVMPPWSEAARRMACALLDL
jgi:Sulfotransferase family/Glycosyl transferases group 1